MILQLDDNDGLNVTATLTEACGQREYACVVTACDNPTCTCGVAYVNLYAMDDGKLVDPSPHLPDHSVCIDVIKKKWVNNESVAPNRQERLFGKAFFKALDDDDLQLLWKLQGMFKVVESEEAPPESFNIAFDFDAVEIDGLMYAYNDVLPYGSRLKTCIDTSNYLLFDHYCLRRDCSCSLVNLAVLHEPQEFSIPLQGADKVCRVLLDYRSRKWDIPKHSCHDSLMRKIRKDAEDHYDGDFYMTLSERHQRLQEIYKHSHDQCLETSSSAQSGNAKVPRNAPCPCGSGKKFKKCCGA